MHLINTATLDALGTEYVRYRPNIVVQTPPGTEPYVANDWVGRELHIGRDGDHGGEDGVVLRVVLPTPRCAVPTLVHGACRAPRTPCGR